MGRNLGIYKRVDLSGLADGWDGCNVLVKPITYGMLSKLNGLETDGISEKQAIETTVQLVKENVVGGTVKVTNDKGELSDDTLQPDDIDQMPVAMVNHIMAEMTGQGAQYGDPKASATQTNDNASQTSSKDSETTSSTD